MIFRLYNWNLKIHITNNIFITLDIFIQYDIIMISKTIQGGFYYDRKDLYNEEEWYGGIIS